MLTKREEDLIRKMGRRGTLLAKKAITKGDMEVIIKLVAKGIIMLQKKKRKRSRAVYKLTKKGRAIRKKNKFLQDTWSEFNDPTGLF